LHYNGHIGTFTQSKFWCEKPYCAGGLKKEAL
jgi:hypothetical protein